MKVWRKYCWECRTTKAPQTFQSFIVSSANVKTYFVNVIAYVKDDEYCFVSQDITSQKQLELEMKNYQEELESLVCARTKELEEALQVKSIFLATVSHGRV